MMCNIDEIMDMLDWNNPPEIQEKGRMLARTVKCFNVFLRPGHSKYKKNVWDNCAMILAEKTDSELRPYLWELFEWLADLNWPGTFCIWDRLKQFEDKEWLNSILLNRIDEAKARKDSAWLSNLLEFRGEPDAPFKNENVAINEVFSKRVYEAIVEQGTNQDRELNEILPINEYMPDYYKKRLELYRSCDENQKGVLMEIIKSTRIDTIERLFRMLDGSGAVQDRRRFVIDVIINGISTEQELLDAFSKVVRENGDDLFVKRPIS